MSAKPFKYLSAFGLVVALQGCSSETQEASHVSAATTPSAIAALTFDQACSAIDANPAAFADAYVKTLAALRKQSSVTDCSALRAAFNNKKLNFASAGFPIALDLLIKVPNVRALDISNNGLKDISALQTHDGTNEVGTGAWGRSGGSPLRELWAQGNQITDASVVQWFGYLEKLDLSSNNIQDLEGTSAVAQTGSVPFGIPSLQYINLANNPFTIPVVDGSAANSNTFKFLSKAGAISYLDVSNTKVQTLDFIAGHRLSYLLADNLKLTTDMNKSGYLWELTYLSLRNTSGVNDGYFQHSSKLIYADFSKSDLADLQDFTDKTDIENPAESFAKKDLTFLFVSGTKVSAFDPIPTAPNLSYFGAAPGFTAPLNAKLQFADYRASAVTADPQAAQVALDACSGPNCVTAPAPVDAAALAGNKFFCKDNLNAKGECEKPYQICDASTITYTHIAGPNSLIKSICCTVPAGVTPELPGIGAIETTNVNGETKICAELPSDQSFFR